MHNANIPDYAELPTNSKLIKSTIIAIIAAAVILITLVLRPSTGLIRQAWASSPGSSGWVRLRLP